MTSAPIFEVQRFSIHDGPGIRTLVFFKGCRLRCAWCQNPESQQPAPQIAFHAQRCQHTLECTKVCPENAIRAHGFRIDTTRCSQCLKCVEACAFEALQPVGISFTPKALMAEILKDRAYFESSGGGVTFSGGEPTLYPRFMAQMLEHCEQENIHTTLETCGSFSFAKWQGLLRQLDLIYFDLKIIDAERHRAATGAGNSSILANAQQLVREGYPVEFRLTLVEGYTDDDANRRAVVELLKRLQRPQLHLLGYHNMGEAKIAIIDGAQEKLGLKRYPAQQLAEMAQWFEQQGIAIVNAPGQVSSRAPDNEAGH